jgi:hypothetical protein
MIAFPSDAAGALYGIGRLACAVALIAQALGRPEIGSTINVLADKT